jgi:hypothetical protein
MTKKMLAATNHLELLQQKKNKEKVSFIIEKAVDGEHLFHFI